MVAKNFPCAKFEKQIERRSVEEENNAEIEEKREEQRKCGQSTLNEVLES